MMKTCCLTCSVGSDGLIKPGTEFGDTGINTRHGRRAGSTTPGHDTNQSPGSRFLADQGTTGVTLKHSKSTQINKKTTTSDQHICSTSAPPTMQEETPEAPAQIMTSLILLPQYRLHCSLLSRGRAACCSRAGVSGAATHRHHTSNHAEKQTAASLHAIYCP